MIWKCVVLLFDLRTMLKIQLAESQTILEHLAILSLKIISNQQKSYIWGTLNILLFKDFILNIPKSFFYDIHFFVIQVSAVMFCVSPVTSHMSLMPIATTTDLSPGNSSICWMLQMIFYLHPSKRVANYRCKSANLITNIVILHWIGLGRFSKNDNGKDFFLK